MGRGLVSRVQGLGLSISVSTGFRIWAWSLACRFRVRRSGAEVVWA